MSEPELFDIDERLRPFLRTAWLPEVADGDGAATDSKFSGLPALRRGEEWPRCANCGRPMQLFVQLDARELPAPAAAMLDGGLLQLFYCTSETPPCESECDAYLPHARSTLVRLVEPGAATGGAGAPPGGMFPPKRIAGWTAVIDLPHPEELGYAGVELDEMEEEALMERDFPRAGEKLLGWPHWVQSVEYPRCRRCAREMTLLFQVDSDRNLPYMFGDAGVGHVTQCPDHHDELAFGWACS